MPGLALLLAVCLGLASANAWGQDAPTAASVQPETLASIVEKNQAARGGSERWRSIQTLQILGVLTLPDGDQIPVSIEMKRPNRLRMEFELQGQTAVQTYDGNEGWIWLPFEPDLKPRRLEPNELEAMAQTADFDGPLIDWRSKGYSLQYLGLEADSDDRTGHLLELTRVNGDRLRLFLDPQTFLVFRQVSLLQREAETLRVTTDLSDYRPVGGVVMPFELAVEDPASSLLQVLKIDAVNVDLPLADDRFVMQMRESGAP